MLGSSLIMYYYVNVQDEKTKEAVFKRKLFISLSVSLSLSLSLSLVVLGPHSCKADALPLEPRPPFFALVIFQIGSSIFAQNGLRPQSSYFYLCLLHTIMPSLLDKMESH
jgi:hypothetical protein